MVTVVENANLQRSCKKISVEYLAWFMENILESQYHNCMFRKHVCTQEVKC